MRTDHAPRQGRPHAERSMTLLHGADLSPDATSVAWCVSTVKGEEETLELRLSRVGQDGFMAFGDGPRDHDVTWSPDGAHLAYLSDRGERTVLMLADAGSLTSTPLMPADGPEIDVASRPVWSPDASYIAYAAVTPSVEDARPYRVTRTVPWVDGVGLVDLALADLYVVDVASGRHVRLTADDRLNHQPCWLEDSSGLVYLASRDPSDWQELSEIRTVDLDGTITTIAERGEHFSIAVTRGGVVTSTLGEGPQDTPRLTVIGTDGNAKDRAGRLGLDLNGDVIGDLPIPFMDPDPLLLVDGDDAVLRVQVEDRLEVHRVALTGDQRHEVLLSGPACHYPLAVARHRLLFARGTITSLPELSVADLRSGTEVRITDLAAENASLSAALTVTDFFAHAEGGPAVQCKFLRSAGRSGPLPSVLVIHGGPKAAFGQAYSEDARLLCDAGFGVLLVNPRGSRGYGVEFADAISGDWGNLDYQDVLAAVDEATRAGLAEPDRWGVTGLSYGGYLSSWIVTHTNRFRAAVIENPVTNLWSLYGTSDIGLSFGPEITGNIPRHAFDAYVRSSPITTAHTCTTPVLLIQGEQDHRCPPEQSMQLYSALKRTGCTVEMLMLPDASHVGSISGPVPARRAQNDALVDWMARHVLD